MSLYKLDSAMLTSAGGDTNLLVISSSYCSELCCKSAEYSRNLFIPQPDQKFSYTFDKKKEVGIIHCTIGMLIGNPLYPFLAKAQQILRKHTNRYQKMHYIG